MRIEIEINAAQALAVARALDIDITARDARQQVERAIVQHLRAIVRADIAASEEEEKRQRIASRVSLLEL